MKQLLTNLKTGNTEIVEVPCPSLKPGHVLIKNSKSLISAGTERILVEFGKSSYWSKARSQPDKVKKVLDKLKSDGLLSTLTAVRASLDQSLPSGYSSVGIINAVEDARLHSMDLRAGDRVVSNGPHAEIVCVPRNLCAKIPHTVSDEEAVFTVLGAIGLQGIRLAQPTLGEAFVVLGLGLIGQLATQILMAHGCRVLGIDLETGKCYLARQFGADTVDLSRGESPLEVAQAFNAGRGVDGVLITAATESSEPVHQAAQMCRKRGRIVLVGVTGLELRRSDFYEKELSFQVSCSYGPGRYDPEYEEKGHDYPLGFVRWTEQRNFEAVLDLMAKGKLKVKPLISHRFPFEEAAQAYSLITDNKESYLGIVLEYETADKVKETEGETTDRAYVSIHPRAAGTESSIVVGLVGAGNFTEQVLLPALQKVGVRFKTIASSGGVSGTHLGKKFKFEESTSDAERIFADTEINTVFVATLHDTHAYFVTEAFKAGKHVFVEKPLCINQQQLTEIVDSHSAIRNLHSEIPLLMVGFNRRFSPHGVKAKQLLDGVQEPKSMIMTVNAGFIPDDHWTQDLERGGGRIIGEACHFVDLLRFLVGHPVKDVKATRIGQSAGMVVREDKITFTLSFADGSFGTVHYLASGHRSFPKERLEVFCAGRILQLDNFKRLRGYGWPGFRKMNLWRQDKGHVAEVGCFIEAIRHGGPAPISFEELIEVTQVTFQVMEVAS